MEMIVLGVLLAFFVLFAIGIYNRLVRARNLIKNSFAQIDVQLKRRYDLIPNLVESVKGYMKHERETLEAVIRARNQAFGLIEGLANNPADSSKMKEFLSAESALTQSLSRLMVVAEQYPDLKASQNMVQFQEELTSTENKVSFARQAFNDAVMIYNNLREVFPNSVVAGFFNFASAEPYQVTKVEERSNVKVNFA